MEIQGYVSEIIPLDFSFLLAVYLRPTVVRSGGDGCKVLPNFQSTPIGFCKQKLGNKCGYVFVAEHLSARQLIVQCNHVMSVYVIRCT